MNKEKQILENQISLNLREDKTLEIYVGDSLAAEISDGRLDMEFAKEILEGLDYEINESSFTIRPLHSDEQKYTYRQGTQIEGQTGSIGYLRGDFGTGGKEFFSSWFDHRRDLKTGEFKSELDEVINALRSEEYGLLKSRTAMAQYTEKYPVSAFQGNYATEYGFRADTEKYSFLIRCNPARGDYNFYCYCYVREWLDRHMERKRLIPTPTGKAKDGAEATRPIIRFPVVSCLPLTKCECSTTATPFCLSVASFR